MYAKDYNKYYFVYETTTLYKRMIVYIYLCVRNLNKNVTNNNSYN